MIMAKKRINRCIIRFLFTLIFAVSSDLSVYALEPLNDVDLDDITAQDGINIVLENFTITYPGGTISIGGEDGLGIPAAPNGAWFVFDFDRVVQFDVEKGEFSIDAFTAVNDMTLGDNYVLPANTTAALINFGEAYFHVNNTEAQYTLKFASGNNPEGDEGNGVTKFADTVCNFAFNGSTITFKSEDAKMYIFSH